MAPESPQLLALAEAVADGREVDWAEAEASARSPDERELVAQLRMLAGVSEVHGNASTSPASLAPGGRGNPEITTWGPLHIRERVGGGSFGTVYKAWDPRLARDVALKLLHRDTSSAEASSIIDEGRLLARVRHPHVITVFGASRFDGRVGIWMEFIRGRTLEEVLMQDGPLSAREAALIGVDLCSALAAVHDQGVVHRDVKTHNVMREQGGRVVLMDFGAGEDPMARETSPRMAGTPLYMAPELFGQTTATPASDLYSLGVLLFHLVTGTYPVIGKTIFDVQKGHDRNERRRLRDVRPDLPPQFVQAVERALAADPAERIESAGALEAALAEGLHSDTAAVASGTRLQQAAAALAGRRALLIGLMLVAGLAGSAWLWSRGDQARPAGVVGPIRSIAVKPLRNLTGDETQAYFAAGLSDVLIAQLGTIRALSVVALSDEAATRPATYDEIASKYPTAQAVFEGSVQRASGRVRVSARLVQLASGAVLWGRTYDIADVETFSLQGRMAADLAGELNVSLSANESRRLSRQHFVNVEAQNAYLRGRYLLDSLTRPNLQLARLELERAVRLDPGAAPAFASLALTYLALGNVGVLSPAEVRELAPAAADAAFKIDSQLAEAALALADVRFRLDWNWQGAEEAYRTAVQLNPSYMEARSQYSRFLAASNRLSEALREAQDAYQIDPLSGDIHSTVGVMLYYTGHHEEAIAHFQQRLDDRSSRGHVGLGRAYAAAGRFPEALAEIARAYELSGRDPGLRAELARTMAAAGQIEESLEILHDLEVQRRAARDYVAPQDLAYIHVALGHPNEAFALLDEAIDERASRLLWIAVDPRVDRLRSDPRYVPLIARLGITVTPKQEVSR